MSRPKVIVGKYVEAETVSEDSENSSASHFTDALSQNFSNNISLAKILIIEPFYGGSHKQLIDLLDVHLNKDFRIKETCIFSLPGKKWHWRARTSALYFSRIIPREHHFETLFCTSVLNLAELIALRLDLSGLHKIIYFHENQLVYPVRKRKDRDFQYGYNQILSSLVADVIIFNSYYNLNSFLKNIDTFLKLQPDFHIKNLASEISPKCKVIYFPIEVPLLDCERSDILHIIWPHRWEHDKNPQLFFETLFKLKSNEIPFKLSVLGEAFDEVPEIFQKAKKVLKDEILQFGRLPCKMDYYRLLKTGHVVVSTATHEFFGVAMLEAVSAGCFPLACNNLVYPELYPPECLYNTPNQLYKKLKIFCTKPYLVEVNPFLEGINKVKDLIQELEESFRESSIVGNNLILRCVFLKAENQNLIHEIDEKKKNYSSTLYNQQWQFSVMNQKNSKSVENNTKRLTCSSQSKTSLHRPLTLRNVNEIEILHKTIGDLQKKLKERNKKIESLCQKYLYLETNKAKMEIDFKSQLESLEKQLDLSYNTLSEYQNEVEAILKKSLSQTKNTYEALFLQEKLRCSKLMYEKVKLHHEIKRLEDFIRKQTVAFESENQYWKVVRRPVNKSSSEPYMKYF